MAAPFATTCQQRGSKVTLLHKGLGPRLFNVEKDSAALGQKSGSSSRSPSRSPKEHSKRIVVKCMEDGQAVNSMFAKRLRARNPPTHGTGNTGIISTRRERQRRMQKEVSGRAVVQHKPSGFPPPSFMARWNPRKMDRTYLDKMVLEDPWSLSPQQKLELQKRTGLRLKSISRHYQFKVRSNLPFGKDALGAKCTCYINHCDHCNKTYSTYRCPLHLQVLDPIESNCKVEVIRTCPFFKHPEDMSLDQIKDPAVYISEVVRRLKAGELKEAPKFPASRFHMTESSGEAKNKNSKDIKIRSNTDPSLLDIVKKPQANTAFTQTEPFAVDVDMQDNNNSNNLSQTQKPPKGEPVMMNVLKPLEYQQPFKAFTVNDEKEVQVNSFEICGFGDYFQRLIEYFTRKIVDQSLRELNQEAKVAEQKAALRNVNQQYADQHLSLEFRIKQERLRASGAIKEKYLLQLEMEQEEIVEELIGAIKFAQSYLLTLPTQAMQDLRVAGTVSNQGLQGIQGVLQGELNAGVEENLSNKIYSYLLIDDMTEHALRDLELGYFKRNMIDGKYLKPTELDTKELREIVELREELYYGDYDYDEQVFSDNYNE